MLTNHPVTVTIPAKDLDRAMRWYKDKLGLTAERTNSEGAFYHVGGTPVFLYRTQHAGTAKHTLLAFETDDLNAEMKALRDRGVAFEEYDMPGLKTKDGVAEMEGIRSAWARDSEGNILAFDQQAQSGRRVA